MDLSNGQSNAEENQKTQDYSELMKIEPITGTDFDVVGSDEIGAFWVAWGKFRMTDNAKTREQALEKLETDKWKLIVKVSAIVHETLLSDAAETIKMLEEQERKKNEKKD